MAGTGPASRERPGRLSDHRSEGGSINRFTDSFAEASSWVGPKRPVGLTRVRERDALSPVGKCTSSEPFGQKGLGFKRVTGSSGFLQATLF